MGKKVKDNSNWEIAFDNFRKEQSSKIDKMEIKEKEDIVSDIYELARLYSENTNVFLNFFNYYNSHNPNFTYYIKMISELNQCLFKLILLKNNIEKWEFDLYNQKKLLDSAKI